MAVIQNTRLQQSITTLDEAVCLHVCTDVMLDVKVSIVCLQTARKLSATKTSASNTAGAVLHFAFSTSLYSRGIK